MPGGILQLSFWGANDIYLTGNPEITFFKIVYKRYSSFAIEQKKLTIYGPPKFGSKVNYCRIRDSGADLLNKIYLTMTVTGTSDKNYKWVFVKNIGHTLIKEYKISIGGKQIDKQYGEWLNIWYELNLDNNISDTYDKMIGNTPDLTTLSTENKSVELFIPLKFWFCLDSGLSFPLISAYNSDVEFRFKFRKAAECVIKQEGITNLNITMSNVALLVNYVLLDTDEREKFINNTQEYLIQQVQHNGYKLVDPRRSSIKLNFNNPCKTLFWLVKRKFYVSGKKFLSQDPEEATKRLILAYCRKNNTHFLSSSDVNLKVGESLVPVESVSANIATIITNATVKKQFTPKTLGSVNDIDIAKDYWLDDKQISMTIDKFLKTYALTTTVRNTTGDGSKKKDIILHQWNNYNLNINYKNSIVTNCDLIVNGKHVYNSDVNDYQYLNLTQGYQYYKNVPTNNLYLYTFSLDPLNFEPLGVLNFSTIDKAKLKFDYNKEFITDFYDANSNNHLLLSVYMESYNILKIENGEASLLYNLTET